MTHLYSSYNQNNITAIAGWYVDDGLIAADTKGTMEEVVRDICRTFTIQDLEEPIHLLGIKIDRNRNSGIIKLSQPAYINKIASRFNTTPGKNISIPMKPDKNLHNTSSDEEKIDVPYASIIGSINYCSVSTHPDITFMVNKCSQFTSNPSVHHWQAAQQIVRYLLQLETMGSHFVPLVTESKDMLIIYLVILTLILPVMSMIENLRLDGYSLLMEHRYHGHQRNKLSLLDHLWNRNW